MSDHAPPKGPTWPTAPACPESTVEFRKRRFAQWQRSCLSRRVFWLAVGVLAPSVAMVVNRGWNFGALSLALGSLAVLLWSARLPLVMWIGTTGSIAVGALIGLVTDPLTGAWIALSTAGAGWLAAAVESKANQPVPAQLFTTAGLGTVAAAVIGVSGSNIVAPLTTTLTTVLLAVAFLRFHSQMRAVERTLKTGAALLGRSLLVLTIGVAVVIFPWLVHRILGLDPLDAPVGPDGFVRLGRQRRAQTFSLWHDRPVVDRFGFFRRARRRLVTPLSIVLLVIGAVGLSKWTHTEAQSPPAAVASATWWPEYKQTLDWYLADGFSAWGYPQQADLQSPYINVVNGRRRTHTQPPCGCRRIRVWMYGGSTTFGMGQRDDHTIASELVKEAGDHGLVLDVSNRGVMGNTHWMEATRFAWDLQNEPPPDQVVFYDGGNDLAYAEQAARNPLDVMAPPDLTRRQVASVLNVFTGLDSFFDGHSKPERAEILKGTGVDDAARMSPESIGRLAASRYEDSRRMSQAIALSHDLSARWFWQPTEETWSPQTPSQGSADARRTADEARRRLDRAVIDLTGSYDSEIGPIFLDGVHTNERGALIIALEMFERLRTDLGAIAGSDT